jgi:hypothetical protein
VLLEFAAQLFAAKPSVALEVLLTEWRSDTSSGQRFGLIDVLAVVLIYPLFSQMRVLNKYNNN